jgi:hypothetical protein
VVHLNPVVHLIQADHLNRSGVSGANRSSGISGSSEYWIQATTDQQIYRVQADHLDRSGVSGMAHLDQADLGSRVVSGVRLDLLDQVDHLSSRCCWIFWIQVGRISLVEQVLWIKRFCQLLMGQVVITAWQVLMVHLDQADHLDCWCCWIFWLSRIKWYKFGKWNNGILGTATYIPLLMARTINN